MAAGLTKSVFSGLRINSQLYVPASCISSVSRKYAKYRTIEDSFRNRTPTYDDENKPEYDRSKPTWSGLEEKESYFKHRYASRILVMNPDYSFVDGKTVPIGGKMRFRYQQQREWAEKIVQYSNEMDFAIERHAQMKLASEQERKNILDSKLKPKGKAFMKSDKNTVDKRKETEEAGVINTVKEAKKNKEVKTKR